jgi:hypothetical protein
LVLGDVDAALSIGAVVGDLFKDGFEVGLRGGLGGVGGGDDTGSGYALVVVA